MKKSVLSAVLSAVVGAAFGSCNLGGGSSPTVYPAVANSLVVSGSTVYVGGYCGNGSTAIAGYWVNGNWVGLTNPYGVSYDAAVNALVVSGSTVYAGGYSAPNSGIRRVAGYWQNGSWVGLAVPASVTWVSSLVISGSSVYAACGPGANGTGYLVNGNWVGLTNPYGASYPDWIYSLVVSGSEVYAGGVSTSVPGIGVENPGYWDDSDRRCAGSPLVFCGSWLKHNSPPASALSLQSTDFRRHRGEGRAQLLSVYARAPRGITTGSAVGETLANMREAISFHLQGMAEDRRPLPTSSTIATQLLYFDVPEQSIQ